MKKKNEYVQENSEFRLLVLKSNVSLKIRVADPDPGVLVEFGSGY